MSKITEYNRRRHEKAKPAYAALMSCYPFTLEDLPGEVWKDIDGFDGYLISNYGRVKSFKYKVKILKPQLSTGYLRVNLWIVGKQKHFSVHVLVAQTFIPNPEDKPQINHKDGCKLNNHVSNLEWATASENCQHAYDKGLAKSGTRSHNAKIKDDADILYIRDNPDNLTQEKLIKKFGVNRAVINTIQRGKTYKNAGGSIRKLKRGWHRRTPDDIREQIRADYKPGVRGFGIHSLAQKYGCSKATVSRIVKEQSVE